MGEDIWKVSMDGARTRSSVKAISGMYAQIPSDILFLGPSGKETRRSVLVLCD